MSPPAGHAGPFTRALTGLGLLDAAQLAELPDIARHHGTPRDIARALILRGWLTPYQANHLLQGKADALVLGRYILLDRIGVGGMGEVYKARHAQLHNVVAVKIIAQDKVSNPTVRERFLREAEAAAQLSHPNIVTVRDADEAAGRLFLVMEYIDGVDLGRLVHQAGPLPVALACDLIRQSALGLHHAHALGYVHRDIKPQNLLAAPQGGMGKGGPRFDRLAGCTVKVLDMGLVRLQPERVEATHLALTQHGVVIGTMDYLAPEQARNAHRVDHRADLYALGCTFYHLLAGEPPFPGGSPFDKLMRHQTGTASPLRARRKDVPAALEALIGRLLAKRPDDRHDTAQDLADELCGIGSGAAEVIFLDGPSTMPYPADDLAPTQAIPLPPPPSAPPPPPPPSRRVPRGRPRLWFAAAAGVGVLTAVAALFASAGGKPKEAAVEKKPPEKKADPPKAQADLGRWLIPGAGAVVGFRPKALYSAAILRPPGEAPPSKLPLDPGAAHLLRAVGVNLMADVEEMRVHYHSPDPADTTWALRGKFKPGPFTLPPDAPGRLAPLTSGRHQLWHYESTFAAPVHLGLEGAYLFASPKPGRVEACLTQAVSPDLPRPDAGLWEAFSRADRRATLWAAVAPRLLGLPTLRPGDPLTPALRGIHKEARAVSGHFNAGEGLHAAFTFLCHDHEAAVRLEALFRVYKGAAAPAGSLPDKGGLWKALWLKAVASATINRNKTTVLVRAAVPAPKPASK